MWCSRTGRWPPPSPARAAPGFSSNSRSDAMTEPAQAIRLDIPRPTPEVVKGFQGLATTAISDVIGLSSVMRYFIHPLWPDMPRIAGPAFTVRTPHHDNLMLHAAIYRAEPRERLPALRARPLAHPGREGRAGRDQPSDPLRRGRRPPR